MILSRVHVRATTPVALPPAGPAWYGSVMGTALLASLLQLVAEDIHGGVVMARALLVLAWLGLIGLSGGFLRRCLAAPGELRRSFQGLVPMAQWGMVSMGLLALGSATATVLPVWLPPATRVAWTLDVTLWVLGTALGLALALVFAAALVRHDPGEPTTIWGLAVVAPMVSATTGAAVAGHAGPLLLQLLVLAISVACFMVALCLGGVVFAVAYRHHWRVAAVPVAASASAWIPLGIVGQSVAAAQALAAAAQVGLTPEAGEAVGTLAHGYGVIVLALGAPLLLWAVRVSVRGFRARMPFSPGWWALTFPLGTIALGTHLLGEATAWPLLPLLSGLAVLTLIGTWSLCTVATVRATLARS